MFFLSLRNRQNGQKRLEKAFLEEVDPRMVIFGEKGEKTTALQKEIGEESVESVEKRKLQKGNFQEKNNLPFACVKQIFALVVQRREQGPPKTQIQVRFP